MDPSFGVFGRAEAPRTFRNKFHDWLEKTIEETTETKDNNAETIEVRVFKNERN